MKSSPLFSLAVLLLAFQPAPAQCEHQKLNASTPSTRYFGFSVALSGDHTVIGAPLESTFGINAGAAYVFHSTISGWVEFIRLFGEDASADDDDLFGHSVAISGNTILVGAPGAGYSPESGIAYVFEYDGSSWIQTAKLTASDSVSFLKFGTSVDLEGDLALIGADGDNAGVGAAYVFERSGSLWTQTAKVTASDGQLQDSFGSSVSLSGGLALVGAPGDDNLIGSAYIFDQAVGWAEVDKLVPSDPVPHKGFGHSVAISCQSVVVGAYTDDTLGKSAGAAYAFENTGSTWSQTQKLYAGDGHDHDFFGYSVAIAGDYLIVGAPEDLPGSAYVFKRGSTGWLHAAVLASSDGVLSDDFGHAVAMEGEVILVGDVRASGPYGDLGAAYVFELPSFGTAYCFGVGCPCGNDDGVRGCANSIDGADSYPQGALLAACGSGSVADDDLVLTLSHLPPNQFGLFYMGGGELQAPFGDGLRCVGAGGAGVFRYNPPQHSGSGGMLTLGPGVVARSQSFSANGHIDAGETWYFQGWYRDPMGPCGTAFNLSNGLAVMFAP